MGKKAWEKFNSTSESCGTISKDLMYVLNSPKKSKEKEKTKIYLKKLKTINPLVEKVFQSKIRTNKITSKYVIVTLLKISYKEKILKATIEIRHITYSGTRIIIKTDF